MRTHEGSGLGNSVNEFKKSVPNATIHQRLAIKGTNRHSSDPIIKNWLNS